MYKCEHCGKEFEKEASLRGHNITCNGEAKPEVKVEAKDIMEEQADIAKLAEALNTMQKLVTKGLSKFCSAAAIDTEEMDTMVKNIKELHDKYNK